MNDFPLVSIIVANWNGGEIFKNCLKSLTRLDYPNFELIVVDNGSVDGSERYVNSIKKLSPQYKLILNEKNLGFAKANNQGFRISAGEFILLLNNDTTLAFDLLSKLVRRMKEDQTIGVIQPKIFLMHKRGYLDNAGSYLTKIGFLQHWGFNKKDGKEFRQETEIFSAKGACLFTRREVIKKVGLFDEDFVSYFEESDFCWRVWLAGYRIIFYPQTSIRHKLGFTIRRQNVLDINYHYYKNRISSLIKNLEAKNLLVILPLHISISLGIMVAFLIKGHPKNSFIIAKSFGWNLFNLPRTLKKRALIQSKRKVKDDFLFTHLSRKVNFRRFASDFKRIEKDIKRKNPYKLATNKV